MKINRARLKEIIRSVVAEEKDYEQFFRSELEKAGFSSPAEMSDDEKREFFNKIDAGWKGKNEGNAFGAAVVKAKEAGEDEFEVGGKKFPVKEEKSKYYIEIDSPREVDSNRVKGEIKSLMKRGARSSEIGLRMNFLTTNPKDLMDKFRVVKNKVYFANDTRRFESVNEGKKRFNTKYGVGKAKYVVSYHDGVKKHKDGSDFFDIQIFKNQKDLEAFKKALLQKGFVAESVNEAELPKDGSTIKVGNTRVKIEYVGKNKDHIGFNWKGDDGESNYEETKVSDHKDMNSLINRIKDEIRYQRIVVSKRKNESVDEGVMKPGKKIRYVTGWAGQNQPVKNDKYVIYQLVNNRYFSLRGISGGMTYLWKAIESTDPHIKVGSTEEIHPKQLKSGLKHGFYVMESVNEDTNKKGRNSEKSPLPVNEGVRISLFDPNKNKILKTLSVDRNYREAEKEVETLNKRLSASEKNKGYYWKVTTIGESVKRMSEGKFDKYLDKVEAAVKGASSFMGVGAELKKAGIKYDFTTSMIPMYIVKVPGNTIAIVNKKYAAGAEREVKDLAIGLLENVLKVEGLSVDVAKHMDKIHKGFVKVEGDGTMIYDSPTNAKKAADILNKNKIAASTDGKYLYIESKKSKR